MMGDDDGSSVHDEHLMPSPRPPASAALGAAMCFGLWGVLPIYWKQLGGLGSDIAVAHRITWTMVWVIPMLLYTGQWGSWLRSIKEPGMLRLHAWSALLLGINWSTFVWAAQHGHILDSSLGYFINPLLNVVIGFALLGERLTRLQKVSVGFAAVGALMQVVLAGRFPWVGLVLAFSMGFYALARRRSPLGALSGLAMETLAGLPFAMLYLAWAALQGRSVWGPGQPWDYSLIIGLGAITAVPLVGFANGARMLPFAMLGLLQFLTPTGHFLIATMVYHEPVNAGALWSFALIWAGVAVFCTDLWQRSSKVNPDD